MNGANFVPPFLAALTTTPATPVPESAAIRDIAPPVDVFPYPPWMVVLAALIALLLLGLLVWAMMKWLRHRPPPPLPSAAELALAELEILRTQVHDLDPYAFSFAVSDVLRTFISKAKFRLPATQQTSPEFLAAISGSPLFSENDRTLLGRFLEKCDMIKFARIQATSADNTELVESALAFVRGGQA